MKKQRAFTLIELMAVVAIIVVLAVVFTYAIVAAQERARIATCGSNLRQVGVGFTAYGMNNNGFHPVAPSANSTNWGAGTYRPDASTAYTVALVPQLWRTPSGLTTGGQPVPQGNMWPMYISDYRVLYCPNTMTSKFYRGFVESYTHYKPSDPSFIWQQVPDIGYSRPNGTSPGYDWNPCWQYCGKQVPIAGAGQLPGNASDAFAAGLLRDPSWMIVLSDVAWVNDANKQWNFDGVTSDDMETPAVNHRAGLNTLYNDGRVAFTAITQLTVDKTKWYGIGANGSFDVFAPR